METGSKMPTYDYECKSCGDVSEKFHSMTAKPRVKCPKCGGATKKLIGAGAGIIFKGSGFYETDYRRKSDPRDGRSGNGSSSEKPSESKSEGKSESKDAAKADKS